MKVHKLLHVSTPRRLPQGVSNSKKHKHNYINIGSTKPNTRIFTMIKTDRQADRAPAGTTHSATGTRACLIAQEGLSCTAQSLDCPLTY